MSLPAPTTGLSERRRHVWSGAGASRWGYKLCMCPSVMLCSHPSQPLSNIGLLPDLGPKMALVEAHGSGGGLTGWPVGGSAHCMVPAAEPWHPRVGTAMGGRFAAGLEQ